MCTGGKQVPSAHSGTLVSAYASVDWYNLIVISLEHSFFAGGGRSPQSIVAIKPSLKRGSGRREYPIMGRGKVLTRGTTEWHSLAQASCAQGKGSAGQEDWHEYDHECARRVRSNLSFTVVFTSGMRAQECFCYTQKFNSA